MNQVNRVRDGARQESEGFCHMCITVSLCRNQALSTPCDEQ